MKMHKFISSERVSSRKQICDIYSQRQAKIPKVIEVLRILVDSVVQLFSGDGIASLLGCGISTSNFRVVFGYQKQIVKSKLNLFCRSPVSTLETSESILAYIV